MADAVTETLPVALKVEVLDIVTENVGDGDGVGENDGVTEEVGVADGFWMACKYPSLVLTYSVPSMLIAGPVLILHEVHSDCVNSTTPFAAPLRQWMTPLSVPK